MASVISPRGAAPGPERSWGSPTSEEEGRTLRLSLMDQLIQILDNSLITTTPQVGEME